MFRATIDNVDTYEITDVRNATTERPHVLLLDVALPRNSCLTKPNPALQQDQLIRPLDG